MGEYFVLANDSVEQVIDANNFPTPHGIKHDSWLTQAHTAILPYLIVETSQTPYVEGGRNVTWHGAWAGDDVRLVGDTNEEYREIVETYTDVSKPVYEELDAVYAWFPDGQLDSEHVVSVSTPAETRAALEEQFEQTADES